jgi:hypothetical protein
MNPKTEKKYKDLARFMSNNREISEYAGNKADFKKFSQAFLRGVADDLRAARNITSKNNCKVSFNPAGPAVAGDPSLYIIGAGQGLLYTSLKQAVDKSCIVQFRP